MTKRGGTVVLVDMELLFHQMTLRAGRVAGAEPQAVSLSNLTVFVGPNSSGKSLALRELRSFSSSDNYGSRHIVTAANVRTLTDNEIESFLKNLELETGVEFSSHPRQIQVPFRRGTSNFDTDFLKRVLVNPKLHEDHFRLVYLDPLMINLDGSNRIGLTNPHPLGKLGSPNRFDSFQVLFADDSLRRKVQTILERALERFFVLDPTAGDLRIVFTLRRPKDAMEEQGLHKEARDYYASGERIENLSDGVKAYTGIIVEVVAGNPRIVLLDEPEAFLHPPLAQQLGSELSALAKDTHKNLFVSTHSSHFLMGCLSSGAPIDVIRLTYRKGTATARVLRNSELAQMMKNPLLRSSGVINALFYEFVVVTESDSDRAFYSEINERLLRVGRGIPNCLFLNAQNKQTTRIITKPLRELGIPTAAIVDIDVLKEGGTVWSSFLESGFIPGIARKGLATIREALHRHAKDRSLELKRAGGVDALSGPEKQAANELFDQLDDYGLFVVRRGELERWLPYLNPSTKHSPEWLIETFTLMGEDPDQAQYARPTEDDVWRFIDQISDWLQNSARKGIPD